MAAQAEHIVTPDQLMTPAYRNLMQREHAAGPWGGDGAKHADEVVAFARRLSALSVIDYGCGTGKLAEALAPTFLSCHEYDPGVAGKDVMPEPADIVCCTDVLEHVEPEFVQNTLKQIWLLARRGAYLSIALKPASKILIDGTNAHWTVRSDVWWSEQIGLCMPFHFRRQELRDNLFVWLWR